MPHSLSGTLYSGSYSSAVSGLYIFDCLTRLVHYQELTSKRLDSNWFTIIYQDVFLHYQDCISRILYIPFSMITHIETSRTTIRIVHPEACTLAHQRVDTSGSFFRNALSSGQESGSLYSLFWWCVIGLFKKAVQQILQK